MIKINNYSQMLLAHSLTEYGPVPTAQDPDGVYPYVSFCETSKRPQLKKYEFVSMENDYIKVTVCPDLGGKVYSLIHKKSNKEVLYSAPIVRPVRILPRQAYVGGGIEVSFPISHTPVQIESVLYKSAEIDGRAYIWCGEKELRFGMQWTVEYSLGEEDNFLTQRTCFYNGTNEAHPWMSWSNAGVEAFEDTEFCFPSGPVLCHGDTMRTIDWEKEGPKFQKDIKYMAGYFWREPDCNAFGVYTKSRGCGLYHTADPAVTPGIKLWSDGINEHTEYVSQWTLEEKQCLEIQAGPIIDQSIKAELKPQERHCHVEFWIPSDCPLDIRKLSLPQPQLIEAGEVPFFDFAREREVSLWQELIARYNKNDSSSIPKPPCADDNSWAPSGIEALEKALLWAADNTDAAEKSVWLFQLGSWYAGNDRTDEALKYLLLSQDDRAFALAGRIYRRIKNDYIKSAECYKLIRSEVFACHPQVVYERDLTLSKLGEAEIEQREYWLNKTGALKDEWLIERRAALLVDKKEYKKALSLLEETQFQLIHQRYAKTRLWKVIKDALNLQDNHSVNWLGEDNLAEFGAYREYQEEA